MNQLKDNRSQYWKNQGVTEKSEGRVYGDDKTGYGCNECCNGDRCDDPTHSHRSSCHACLGTGQNLTSDRLNNQTQQGQ
jgi:hypothetical protein